MSRATGRSGSWTALPADRHAELVQPRCLRLGSVGRRRLSLHRRVPLDGCARGGGGRTTLADTDGGTDWIDASAVTGVIALSLVAGATTKVNGTSWFTIDAAPMIENAVTGDGNDTITGNGAANKLYGMRGNDTLDGGAGADELHAVRATILRRR